MTFASTVRLRPRPASSVDFLAVLDLVAFALGWRAWPTALCRLGLRGRPSWSWLRAWPRPWPPSWPPVSPPSSSVFDFAPAPLALVLRLGGRGRGLLLLKSWQRRILSVTFDRPPLGSQSWSSSVGAATRCDGSAVDAGAALEGVRCRPAGHVAVDSCVGEARTRWVVFVFRRASRYDDFLQPERCRKGERGARGFQMRDVNVRSRTNRRTGSRRAIALRACWARARNRGGAGSMSSREIGVLWTAERVGLESDGELACTTHGPIAAYRGPVE